MKQTPITQIKYVEYFKFAEQCLPLPMDAMKQINLGLKSRNLDPSDVISIDIQEGLVWFQATTKIE